MIYDRRMENRAKTLPDAVKRKVTDFYLNDANSTSTAGKKQTITKGGVKMQKRYLADSIVKIHEKYQKSTHFKVS